MLTINGVAKIHFFNANDYHDLQSLMTLLNLFYSFKENMDGPTIFA